LVAPVKNEEGIAVMYIVNHEDVTWSPNKDDEVTSKSMSIIFSLLKKLVLAISRVVWLRYFLNHELPDFFFGGGGGGKWDC